MSDQTQNTAAQSGKTPKKEDSTLKKWVKDLVFAAGAAILIRAFIFEVFAIPTSSMEDSMLVGDVLVCSKLHYGSRITKTPLQIPFTHQKIQSIGMQSYSDMIELPYMRVPGFSEVKRGEPVIFNYPVEIEHPLDQKTYYVKRCVALPGDVLEIKGMQLQINGEPVENPKGLQYSYHLVTKTTPTEKFFESYGIKASDIQMAGAEYYIHAMPSKMEEMRKHEIVTSLTLLKDDPGQGYQGIFPANDSLKWNKDNYGPLEIPSKGKTFAMNAENISKYGFAIQNYEGLDKVDISGNKLVVDGKELTDYTFKQDYYFMMGDNRHNSLDSRFWGFVPEDHIVGKPLLVLISFDENKSFPSNIRWNKIFSFIK